MPAAHGFGAAYAIGTRLRAAGVPGDENSDPANGIDNRRVIKFIVFPGPAPPRPGFAVSPDGAAGRPTA